MSAVNLYKQLLQQLHIVPASTGLLEQLFNDLGGSVPGSLATNLYEKESSAQNPS